MKLIWVLIYNVVFYPLLFVVGCLFSLLNNKFRKGVFGRFQSISKLTNYFKTIDQTKDIYWFHAASLGEFYQVKPEIDGLKEVSTNNITILSFSSPSGFENAKSNSIDFKFYMPFDFPWSVNRALKIIAPKKIIFASYDIWPNMVWMANRMDIHTNIFSARVKDGSIKLKPVFMSFYKSIYQSLSTIYTVADKDYKRIKKIIGVSDKPILRSLGNPRYDMVMKTVDDFTQVHQQSVLLRQKRIIIGSAHSEDDENFIPVLSQIMKDNPDYKVLYAPHEPGETEISRIQSLFKKHGFESSIFQKKDSFKLPDERVIVLGIVGVLSKLYWQGQIAYVGGGFSTGIHNVMEPAIARLPVLFGPNYQHAHEAEELLENSGGFCINTRDEFNVVMNQLISEKEYYLKTSFVATEVIHNNLGSSTRIIRSLIRE